MKRMFKVLSCILCVALVGCMCVFMAGAEGTTSAADMTGAQAITAAQTLFNQITGVLNFQNVASVLGIGIAAVIGIWLAWWGLRKLFSMLQRVLTKGRVSL